MSKQLGKKCLVLGANGFLGSYLIDELVADGYTVSAFDRFAENKIKFHPDSKIKIISGNFLNRHDLKEAVSGVDYVFHFISTTNPATAEDDPLIDIETNLKMSVELFEECVAAGVKKVIFASTGGAIYGLNSSENVSEETLPKPVSPYAICKLSIEQYLRYFEKKHGLKSLTYRISNPYGERQSLFAKQGVIPIFLQQIAKQQPITILGDGSMVRDYIHAKDVAHLIVKSFEAANHELYNLGSGQGYSVNELVEVIQKVVNQTFSINHQPNLSTFVDKVVLNTKRFTDEFGLKPQIGLDEGIRLTWDHINKTVGL